MSPMYVDYNDLRNYLSKREKTVSGGYKIILKLLRHQTSFSAPTPPPLPLNIFTQTFNA